MSSVLNLNRQRSLILCLWFAGLVINVMLLLFVDFSQYQAIDSPPEGWREPINKLYMDLFTMYAPPLTTMLAIILARRAVPAVRRKSAPTFVIAISLSLFWNCIMTWQNARMSIFQTLDIKTLAALLPILPGRLSFLVTPVLAFYFSSEKQ